MAQRDISFDDVEAAIAADDMIAEYPDDKPYPSKLLLGKSGRRPIHVVVAENATEDEIIVITVYEPDVPLWETGFRRRRPQ